MKSNAYEEAALMDQRIQKTTWRCILVRLDRNWLNLQTKKLISGLIYVKYNSLPIRLLKVVGFDKGVWVVKLSLWLGSIGVVADLTPNRQISWRMPKMYFLWHIDIPCEDLATSNPNKYFKFP